MTTSQLAEGSNLYYTNARVDARIAETKLSLSHNTTSELAEGSNLYYTTARVDERIALYERSKTTSEIPEGSNLYFTEQRVDNVFDIIINTKTTSELLEGSNLYFTNNRFDEKFATKTSDNLTEGIHNKYIIDNVYNGDISIIGQLTASNINVSNLNILIENIDSSNVYYTNSRISKGIDELFSLKTADNIKEGTSNLYFTLDRVNEIFDINLARISTDNIKEGTSNLYYKRDYLDTEISIILTTKTTDNLTEGTSNLYLTNSRVEEILSNHTTDIFKEGTSNFYCTDNRIRGILSTISSDSVIEGSSNLYFTEDRVNKQIDLLYNSSNTNGVTVQGWDNSIETNIGFKCKTPFYLGLYLSSDQTTGLQHTSYQIPFIIDYDSSANTYNSLSSTSNYWVSNFFTPPVKGMYIIDYSIATSAQGTVWINKGSDITSKTYNMIYNTQYITVENTSITSSIHILTSISDSWSFIYYPSVDSAIVYSELTGLYVGNTKASILLLQEIM